MTGLFALRGGGAAPCRQHGGGMFGHTSSIINLLHSSVTGNNAGGVRRPAPAPSRSAAAAVVHGQGSDEAFCFARGGAAAPCWQDGGGMYGDWSSSITLSHSSVTGNHAHYVRCPAPVPPLDLLLWSVTKNGS